MIPKLNNGNGASKLQGFEQNSFTGLGGYATIGRISAKKELVQENFDKRIILGIKNPLSYVRSQESKLNLPNDLGLKLRKNRANFNDHFITPRNPQLKVNFVKI